MRLLVILLFTNDLTVTSRFVFEADKVSQSAIVAKKHVKQKNIYKLCKVFIT